MEFKTDALVLRVADYGENDRIATLLTADRGKLSACLKGVRKAGAKLKFASQPFCFAEFVLAERGGRHTVTGASLHDGFYALREDVTAFYAAACVAEACDVLVYEGMRGGTLVEAVRALGALSDGAGPSALLSFLRAALSLAGYPVRAGACPVCGKIPSGRLAFDMDAGTFACAGCFGGVPASQSAYEALRRSAAGEEGSLDGTVRALRLLGAYFCNKTDAEISSLGEYLRLVRQDR